MLIRVDRDRADHSDATGGCFLKNTRDLPRAPPRFVGTRRRTFRNQNATSCRRNAAVTLSNTHRTWKTWVRRSLRRSFSSWEPLTKEVLMASTSELTLLPRNLSLAVR